MLAEGGRAVADDAEDGEEGGYPAVAEVAGYDREAEESDEHRGHDNQDQAELLGDFAVGDGEEALRANAGCDD